MGVLNRIKDNKTPQNISGVFIMQKNEGFVIKGAFILAIGALLTKVIGAIYRVPLTNVLGAEGIGIYQAVFPIYVLLLDFSGTAVPSAISKIISGYKKEDKNQYALRILKSSIKLFSLISWLTRKIYAKLSESAGIYL